MRYTLRLLLISQVFSLAASAQQPPPPPPSGNGSNTNMVAPDSQVKWPMPSCSTGVYMPSRNACVPPGTAANPAGGPPQIQTNFGGVFGASSYVLPIDQFGFPTDSLATKTKLCLLQAQTNGGGTCDGGGMFGGVIDSDTFVGVTGLVPLTVKFGPGLIMANCAGSNAYAMQPPSNVHITGNSTTIMMSNAQSSFCRIFSPIVGAQNIEIDHLVLDGNMNNNTNTLRQNHAIILSDQNIVSIHDNHFQNVNGDGIIMEGGNVAGAVTVSSITGNGTTQTVTTTGTVAIPGPLCVLYSYTTTPSIVGADACPASYTLISANPFTFSFPSSFVGTIGGGGVVIPQNNANWSSGVTTDGTTTQYLFQLPNLPVQPGSLIVNIGTSSYTDNRQQQLIPTPGSLPVTLGACSYTSGWCNILFLPTTAYPLTAAGAASGGATVYTGSLTNCNMNACAGQYFTVAGFTNAGNNSGPFLCTASTNTTLTLANPSGVAETHAGTATGNAPAAGQTITASWSSGAQLGITGFQIYNNTFTHINRASISCISCRDGSVHSNIYDQNIQFNPLHWEPDSSYQYGSYINVYDEHYNTPGVTLALTVGGQAGNAQQCEHVNVHDNWFRGGAFQGQRCPFSQFNNNHLFSIASSQPVLIAGKYWQVKGNQLVGVNPNALRTTGSAGMTFSCGAAADMSGGALGTGGMTISDNYIEGTYGTGMSLTNCGDTIVHHNTIKNIKPNGSSTVTNSAWGISIASASVPTRGLIVDANIVDDDQGAVITGTVTGGAIATTTLVNPGKYTVAPTLTFTLGGCTTEPVANPLTLNGRGIVTPTYSSTGVGCTSFPTATFSGGAGGPTMQRGIYLDPSISNAVLSNNWVSPVMLNVQFTDSGVGTIRNGNYGISNANGNNCISSTSPAVCGSSSNGAAAVAASASTVVINTTAVSVSSNIQLTFDSSLGSRLGVTCNTTPVLLTVSAKTAGTSFTVNAQTAPTTNPACFSYTITN